MLRAKGIHQATFKGVRAALKQLAKFWRNKGMRRGMSAASTATTALTWAQLKRVQCAYKDYVKKLRKFGVTAEFLHGEAHLKNGLNCYGRQLEAISHLVMLDMGTYGGGRARNDYSLYRCSDILLTNRGYWVLSGDWRKTDRVNYCGQYVGRGPYFVPDVDGELQRMKLLLSGRNHLSGSDKWGKPLNDRLFLRADKHASEGGKRLWRNEVRGFSSWDPIKVVSVWCQKNEKWSQAIRSLGSLRHMLETGLIRCGVPARLASAFIGHEVDDFDNKKGDRRIKDYTYALGHTMRDVVRVLMIISSGFKKTWGETEGTVDDDLVETMISECPPEIQCTMFDEEARIAMNMERNGFVVPDTATFGMRRVDTPMPQQQQQQRRRQQQQQRQQQQ